MEAVFQECMQQKRLIRRALTSWRSYLTSGLHIAMRKGQFRLQKMSLACPRSTMKPQ